MGVRLYFRNKDKPDNEYCLGKFLGYAETSDHAKLFDHEPWDVREELQFIQQNASVESRWEFRLF